MEIKSIAGKAGGFIKKYQYILLVIIIGFILLVIPTGKKKHTGDTVTTQKSEAHDIDLQNELSVLLSRISGAGEVEVLLTRSTGEEQLFQTNENSNGSLDTSSKQYDTVIITDSNHDQSGLVRKTLAPTYRGAIVICEGADNPSVRLAIVEAVANATGLSTNRISVLKMK